ncbi:MAG: site-2 protease family protein [Microthrixaceae bacterium]|nr:site-2 protease family protein [Microthrixaceae bacterium]MCO5317195.1 site-2 protease family protein [Microthrixaceae bacterium]
MRSRGVSLGRLAGVDVSAEFSTLLIAGLLAWSFAEGLLPAVVPERLPIVYWSVGIVGSLLFLGSLLIHELSHSVVARRNGVGVRGITLWLFGGVAELESDPPGPGAEFRIAAAGPAASFVFAAASFALSLLVGYANGPRVWVVMLGYLAVLNVFLAVFNLLPGAPLDGGRILGSVLWKIRGDRASGMAGAARVGMVVAGLVVAAGFAEMWFTGTMGGLWTVLIGAFLFSAARAELAYYATRAALGGVPVSSVMLHPVQVTSMRATIAEAVHGPFATSSQTALPVVDPNQQIRGLLTMEQVRRVPAERWGVTEASAVMYGLDAAALVSPSDPVGDLVGRIGASAHALVLHEGRLVGLVGPHELQRAARLPAGGNPVTSTST